jgi:hypothetical protein
MIAASMHGPLSTGGKLCRIASMLAFPQMPQLDALKRCRLRRARSRLPDHERTSSTLPFASWRDSDIA